MAVKVVMLELVFIITRTPLMVIRGVILAVAVAVSSEGGGLLFAGPLPIPSPSPRLLER